MNDDDIEVFHLDATTDCVKSIHCKCGNDVWAKMTMDKYFMCVECRVMRIENE